MSQPTNRSLSSKTKPPNKRTTCTMVCHSQSLFNEREILPTLDLRKKKISNTPSLGM